MIFLFSLKKNANGDFANIMRLCRKKKEREKKIKTKRFLDANLLFDEASQNTYLTCVLLYQLSQIMMCYFHF